MMDKPNIKILTPVNLVGFILVMMAGWTDTVGIYLFWMKDPLYDRTCCKIR